MTRLYYRPLAQLGPTRPDTALTLAGGWAWFDKVEVLSRNGHEGWVEAADLPEAVAERLSAPRKAMSGLDMSRPRIMGILNVTPDSFSDGGAHYEPSDAAAHAQHMNEQGADIIDVGGESTRPGSDTVPAEQEAARILPVIKAIRAAGSVPVSVDTRKADVARLALSAGATMLNDVSALTYDVGMAAAAAEAKVPICLMHAKGDPKTMQDDPSYTNVVLDVYDFLEETIASAEAAGIPRARIMVDPGIGFGKTMRHNLDLIGNLSLFHGLGCAILLGVSRKRFIGELGNAPKATDRAPGSIAVGLAALAQGVQVLRVHDVAETDQAVKLWAASHGMRL